MSHDAPTMTIGTKSILFGAHCFFLHPWFVAAAWWKLYGCPFDPRLWFAFGAHDLGYFGKPNMDGPEGLQHVELGAKIMGFLFGNEWGDFSRYHSRAYAKTAGRRPSRLCFADKLAVALTPIWLYLPMARLTGELFEYMGLSTPCSGSYEAETSNQERWYRNLQEHLRDWVYTHKDDLVGAPALDAVLDPE